MPLMWSQVINQFLTAQLVSGTINFFPLLPMDNLSRTSMGKQTNRHICCDVFHDSYCSLSQFEARFKGTRESELIILVLFVKGVFKVQGKNYSYFKNVMSSYKFINKQAYAFCGINQ